MKSFLKRKKSKVATQEAAKITNETVAEHREQVLAGGRKFKYPVQYQKHKLVINTIIIGLLAVVALVIIGWQQLYVAQNTSKLLYRITQLIPVSVASVDNEPVRYSDYLMRYRSSIYYLQKQDLINLNSKDGQEQASYVKRREIDKAERNAYVTKLAREKNISVSDQEINEFIQQDIDNHSVSMNAYERTVLNSVFDLSLEEYRSIVRSELLNRKVGFAIDNNAKERADKVVAAVKDGADFAGVAKEHSDDQATKANGGDSGTVPVNSLDPNKLIVAAQKLEPGQVSELLHGVDSYYLVKLVSKSKDNIQYRVIKISLNVLDKQFQDLKKSGKIKEHIAVREDFAPVAK